MIGIADPARAETDLGAGMLRCPGCGGRLHYKVAADPRDYVIRAG
jgi:hypothetical protein